MRPELVEGLKAPSRTRRANARYAPRSRWAASHASRPVHKPISRRIVLCEPELLGWRRSSVEATNQGSSVAAPH